MANFPVKFSVGIPVSLQNEIEASRSPRGPHRREARAFTADRPNCGGGFYRLSAEMAVQPEIIWFTTMATYDSSSWAWLGGGGGTEFTDIP
jgi:hypothetical protein